MLLEHKSMVLILRHKVLIVLGIIVVLETIYLIPYFTSQNVQNIRQRIIIDTDCGADDAMAIAMLALSPDIKIEAITTVSGNTGAENASSNVIALLRALDVKYIPVFKGEDIEVPTSSQHYFGYDGLGDFIDPKMRFQTTAEDSAGVALSKLVSDNPGKLTLLSLGPLTNIALANHLNPNFMTDLKDFIFVGASYQGGGNIRPGVEFNVACDTVAAKYVFLHGTAKKPLTIVPYETWKKYATFSKAWRTNTLGRLSSSVMNFLNKAEAKALKNIAMWSCPDQVGAALLLRPDIKIGEKRAALEVEVSPGSQFDGVTYAAPGLHNIIVTKLDRDILKSTLLTSFSDEVS